VRHERVTPTVVDRTEDGDLLLDFGQNLVGWLRLEVNGSAGDEIVVQHAEVLDAGELALRPLRSAKATDRFILSGGSDIFEPTFTFHGFRYVRITGWPGTDEQAIAGIRAVVVGSRLTRTGYFRCSDPALTKLHENVVWGMRGNFVGIPTDCPQRDERMGYLGDLAAFAPTATFLYDVDDFLRDWFTDVAIEQRIGGGQVPMMVPNNLKYDPMDFEIPADYRPAPMAMWQDGVVWIPWTMWEQYGDRRILEQQRESIAQYLDIVEGALEDNGTLTGGYQLGDWLDPAAPPDDPRGARADREVLATACMFRTADLAARISQVLGDDEESAAGNRLADLVAADGFVIPTGFIGTPFVLHALSDTGHTDTAYRLIQQRQCPSWLYQVDMGATTVWERWDSMQPDGSINPGEMTSFNHYAFGSVGDWMHRVIAGISPLEPGYGRILFAPQPGGELTSADASLATPAGTAAIRWATAGNELTVDVTVPGGAIATLRLPGADDTLLEAGKHHITTQLPSLVAR
jgi:alpha-L-rhamnosidase